MANEYLKHIYTVSLFANSEHCEQILANTATLGNQWVQIQSANMIPETVRGIYVITLVSPYKLESENKSHSFRSPLFVDKTEDVRSTFDTEQVLSDEVLQQLAATQDYISLNILSDLEFWFLPIPNVSIDLIDNLLTSFKSLFNPPYNPRAVTPVKASTVTNLSAPAF